MLTSAVCFLLLGVFTAVSKAGAPWNQEQRWVSEMLDPARYDVATRPVENVTHAVEVTVEMIVFSIFKLDSKNQELMAVTTSKMGWEDKRLRWDPSDYSGMESLVVKARMVWYPNILILNAIDETTLIPSDTEVLVTSEGELFRVPKYYMYTVMVPITILTVMASCVFWLPPECGEKLSFSVSVFFGFVIFQLVLQDDLAAAGDNKPSILIRYVLFNFALTGAAVIESAITLILRNKSDDPKTRDPYVIEETSKRSGNKSQDDNEDSPRMLWKSKNCVPRNWKKIAVYVDRISFILFWLAYIVDLIALVVDLQHDGECPRK